MDEEIVFILGSRKEHLHFPFKTAWLLSEGDLPEEGCFAVAFILEDFDNFMQSIVKLRKRHAYHLTPLFYWGDSEKNQFDLDAFDGKFDDSSLKIAKQINEHIQALPHLNFENNTEVLLLSYLFTRPRAKIAGYLTLSEPKGISYPLVKALIGQPKNFDEWSFLENLVSRDLLARVDLIDEIQTCPFCHSGLLNYKNSCPNCHSVDIRSQQFIHCFSCGNIGPMNEFFRQEKLICPRCHTKLRHIGIDYDKPLEDKLCNQCSFYFLDAEINVICMNCLKVQNPEKLVSRRVYTYQLSKRGEFLARGIEKKIQTDYSQFFDFIAWPMFMAILKWQLQLATRYKDLHFSLLALKIANKNDILNEFGIHHAEKLLTEFYERLRNIFRESDLATQEEDFLLFFLPMTNKEGCEVILKRIRQFSEQQRLSESPKKLLVTMSYMTSSEMIQSKQEASLLVASLHSRMDQND